MSLSSGVVIKLRFFRIFVYIRLTEKPDTVMERLLLTVLLVFIVNKSKFYVITRRRRLHFLIVYIDTIVWLKYVQDQTSFAQNLINFITAFHLFLFYFDECKINVKANFVGRLFIR